MEPSMFITPLNRDQYHQPSAADIERDFRAAMMQRGLLPPAELVADGRIHRCAVQGKGASDDTGSYLLHLDGLPAGGFQNWSDSLEWQDWHYKPGGQYIVPPLSASDPKLVERKKSIEQERARRVEEAAQ